MGGTVITGPITTTQTVWIYDATAYGCSDEESFVVTIENTPVITNPGAQTACDSYPLPAITGSNLTGNEAYYSNSQALGGTVITGPITTTQTVWIYDATAYGCSDEESFVVTIENTPVITNPGAQTACDSYPLPAITGSNLTGNEAYYSNSQALGGTVITGPITTTQTVWIYDATAYGCSDEESFVVTIENTPVITNPGAQTACDSYPLPAITGSNLTGNEAYYSNSQALGGTVITGPITTTQTVWIYDATAYGCSDEESFVVTIENTPVITNPGAQTACDSYPLPAITGSNLTGNEAYYSNSQALGGTVITGPITTTQTVWIYDATAYGCSDEESFVVTIENTPVITNPGAQTACDSYPLPAITGSNLTGNEAYYSNSQALGGTVITGPITTTQTVWIYDATAYGCSDEESFVVTIENTPVITNPGAQTACDSYPLPAITGSNLTGNEAYYSNSQALGGTVITGPITTTQTVWIYDATAYGCSDEESFVVTIENTPVITNPGAQTACDSYPLPAITGSNLTGNEAYYSNSQALGGTVITGPITTTQTVWIYDATAYGCSDEESFVVTIENTPVITNPGAQTACDSYPLPAITGSNLTGNEAYYSNSQALGGTVITGPITTTQTVWIYDATAYGCSDEESFVVTIENTPVITNPGAQTACDSYPLPAITGSNLTGNEAYYSNSQALGGTVITGPITTTQTVWIYDATAYGCSDEESFVVTIENTPVITNPGAQTACDSYPLPAITGSNLTGNEAYYSNSQALGGTVITGPITTTQTVWIYDATAYGCSDEESFVVTIENTPVITNPGAQTACDSYPLPAITGSNLTGNEAYYSNSQALGGTVITGPITTTQTVWIYDATAYGCSDEESFVVTIENTPVITNPGAQTACDSYPLPAITGSNLTGNEAYYSNSQALGGTVITGPITTTQTVWIYDATAYGCSDEESFVVTIENTPVITNPGAQTACDSSPLPAITGSNLTGNEAYYSNSQALGGTVITGPITTTQTVWIYDATAYGCSDEESFVVTIENTPVITNPGAQTSKRIVTPYQPSRAATSPETKPIIVTARHWEEP